MMRDGDNNKDKCMVNGLGCSSIEHLLGDVGMPCQGTGADTVSVCGVAVGCVELFLGAFLAA